MGVVCTKALRCTSLYLVRRTKKAEEVQAEKTRGEKHIGGRLGWVHIKVCY